MKRAKPAVQLHPVEPAVLVLPTGQSVQDVEPGRLNLPAGQTGRHAVSTTWKVSTLALGR